MMYLKQLTLHHISPNYVILPFKRAEPNEGSHINNSDFQEYVHLLNSLQIKIRKEKKNS